MGVQARSRNDWIETDGPWMEKKVVGSMRRKWRDAGLAVRRIQSPYTLVTDLRPKTTLSYAVDTPYSGTPDLMAAARLDVE